MRVCACVSAHMCVCASLLDCGMNESSIRVAYRPTEKGGGGRWSGLIPPWLLTETAGKLSFWECVSEGETVCECVYLRQGLDHRIQQGSHSCRHLQQLQH